MSITKEQWRTVCDWIHSEQLAGNKVTFKPHIPIVSRQGIGALFADNTEPNTRVGTTTKDGGLILYSNKNHEPQILTHKNFNNMRDIIDHFEVKKSYWSKEENLRRAKERLNKRKKLP